MLNTYYTTHKTKLRDNQNEKYAGETIKHPATLTIMQTITAAQPAIRRIQPPRRSRRRRNTKYTCKVAQRRVFSFSLRFSALLSLFKGRNEKWEISHQRITKNAEEILRGLLTLCFRKYFPCSRNLLI